MGILGVNQSNPHFRAQIMQAFLEKGLAKIIANQHSLSEPLEDESFMGWFNRSGARDIQILDLSDQGLIPASFVALLPALSKIENLKELILNNNLIFCIPEEISQLKALKKLHLRSNECSRIEELLRLDLESLDISENPIHALFVPVGMDSLKHLVADHLEVYFGNSRHAEDLHTLCHNLDSISVKSDKWCDFGYDTSDIEKLKKISLNRMDEPCQACFGQK